MDALDLRIVAELDGDSRQSFSKIAKKLGVTRRTVQRRVAKLVENGFIRSFEILFDQETLGFAQAVCNVRVRSSYGLNPLRERLLAVRGVTQALTFIGGVIVTYVSYRDQNQLEEILLEIGSIEGVADIDYEVSPKKESPIRLDRGDWEIVRELNHKARREMVEVARAVGISSRTVQRRLQFLSKKGLVRFGVQVDISKATDLFPYILMVKLQPGGSKSRILAGVRQAVPNVWRTLRSVDPFLLSVASSAERLSDLDRDVELVRTMLGVQAVSVLFNTSDTTNEKWLDAAVDAASQARNWP